MSREPSGRSTRASPCRRTRRRQLGVEVFLRFGHLVFGASLEALQWTEVFARLLAHIGQSVGIE